MRKIAVVAVVAGLVASLVGCSTSTPSGTCTPSVKSGDSSSVVAATGTFAAEPTVTIPTPLVAKKPEVTVISAGSGKVIYPGQNVDFQATVLNGKTSDVIFDTSFDNTHPARAKADSGVVGIGPSLQCVTVGSRIAIAMPVRDFNGKAGLDPGLQLGLDDTLVFVIDIVARYLGRADGVDQLPQAGFPSIALAADGRPGVTIASAEPPSTLKIEVLKRGTGQRVEENDHVVLAYTGVDWTTRKVFQTSWDDVAHNIQVKDLDPSDGTGLIDGVVKALIGQPVGSQVVVIIPPKFGFPSGTLPNGLSEGSTIIYVLDVLGIVE